MATAANAAEKDFTITVPVRLYKMVQGVGKAKVICEVLDSQGQRIGADSKWSTNHVNAYPTGLEEDIVLEFNANPGKDPRTAATYKCDLKLQLAWISGEPWQTPSQNSNSMYLKPKPGTEFRVEDSGPIPQAPNIRKQGIDPKIKLRR
jgi:predicted Rdx family selenoprotein